MASRNSKRFNQKSKSAAPTVDAPVQDEQIMTDETATTPTQIVSDDVTKQEVESAQSDQGTDTKTPEEDAEAPVEPTQPEEPAAPVENPGAVTPELPESDPVEAEEPTVSADSPNVVTLKNLLAQYKEAMEAPGKQAKDFLGGAKIAVRIAKLVTDRPTEDVLQALLDFFIENKDGVIHANEALKGATLLPANDAQHLMVLWAVFSDLAYQNTARIDAGKVLTVLKSQPILAFYTKRRAGYMQNR